MAGGKRTSSSTRSSCDSSHLYRKKNRRQITVTTFEMWQSNYNASHKSLTWLQCDTDPSDRSLVSLLWREPCRKYESRIKGLKSFSSEWIQETSNQRTSRVIDHANSSQHKASMSYLKVDQAKANNEPVTSFSPFACSLMYMDATTRERMKHKFDICYVMAEQGMAFSKYPTLYDLG